MINKDFKKCDCCVGYHQSCDKKDCRYEYKGGCIRHCNTCKYKDMRSEPHDCFEPCGKVWE